MLNSPFQSSPFFNQSPSDSLSYSNNPAFFAYLTANQNNATGDGTNVYVVYNNVSTAPAFDLLKNFNTSTGGFKAPVTGRYQFNFSVKLSGLTSAHTLGLASINVIPGYNTPDVYLLQQNNPYSASSGTIICYSGSVQAMIPASSVVYVNIQVSNSTKVISFGGNMIQSNSPSFFSGFLI